MELKFGLFALQMNEVYQDCVHNFSEMNDNLKTLNGKFIESRAKLHLDCIEAVKVLLCNRVGFINCIKIRIADQRGTGDYKSISTLHKSD